MSEPTPQERIIFIGSNIDTTTISANTFGTDLIVTVQGGNVTMIFEPAYYLLALFSFYTQKASKQSDVYQGLKELIKGKAVLMTKREEMILQMRGMRYHLNKDEDFSGVVRQFDSVIDVYNTDIQSNLLKNQIDTNKNVQDTNDHIRGNNQFINRVFKWTLGVALASLFASGISVAYSIKDYNREVAKDNTETQLLQANSLLQEKNLENGRLKNENLSYQIRVDSLLKIVQDSSQ